MAQYDGTVIIKTDIDQAEFNKGLKNMEAEARNFTSTVPPVFNKGLKDMENEMKGFGSRVPAIAKKAVSLLSVAFGAFGTKEIARMAGVWTDLESRVRVASKELVSTSDVLSRLGDIANRAYSPLEKTADAFLSNSYTLNALGLSMEKQLDLTDALTNALVVSGAKGDQFNIVMDSITRAMATGKLKTIELNNVLKYGGEVANVLAKSLGVSVVELRGLSAQGKITSEVIANALIGSMEELRQKADEMPATIADSFTRLRNRLLQFSGEINEAFNFEQSVVKGIDAVNSGIEALGKGLGPLADMAGYLPPIALGYLSIKAAQTKFVQGVAETTKGIASNAAAVTAQTQAWAKQEGLFAAVKSQFLGLNQVIGENTRIVVQNSLAEIESNTAKLNRINRGIKIRETVLAENAAMRQDAFIKKNSAVAEAQLAKLQGVRATVQKRLTISTRTLAAAEGEAVLASRALAVAGSTLKAAFSGLMSVLGGPLGIALTAITLGTFAFTTRQSEAEKAAKSLGYSLDELSEAYNKVGKSADDASEKSVKASDRLRASQAQNIQATIDDTKTKYANAISEIAALVTEIQGRGFDVFTVLQTGANTYQETLVPLSPALQAIRDQLGSLWDEFSTGKISLEEFKSETETLEIQLKKLLPILGETEKIIVEKLLAAWGKLGLGIGAAAKSTEDGTAAIEKQNKVLETTNDLTRKWAEANSILNKNEVKIPTTLAEAAEFLAKNVQETKGWAEQQKALEAEAQRVALAIFAQQAAVAAATQEWATFVQITAELANITSMLASGPAKGVGGGGGGAGKSIKNQQKALREVELTLAELRGDYAKIAEIENLNDLEKFIDLLKEAGITGAAAAEKIEEFNAAQAKKVNTKNLEAQLDFYKELRDVMPKAGEEYARIRAELRKLEEEQYRAIGISEEFLAVWRENVDLKEATDAISGLRVAINDYLSDLTGAKVAGDYFTSTADSIADALFNVMTGAESAGEAFSNMAKSMLDELIKIMIQLYVMQPIVKAMQGMLGGSGGGGLLSMFGFADGGTPKAAGLKAYANQIVSKPTIFPFASGGTFGLMGEAGAEAIMPLKRMKNNQLGVSMEGMAVAAAPVNLQVINQTSVKTKTSVTSSVGPDGSTNLRMMIKEIDSGMTGLAAKGQSTLNRSIEQRAGLATRNARTAYFK